MPSANAHTHKLSNDPSIGSQSIDQRSRTFARWVDETAVVSSASDGAEPDTIHWLSHLEVPNLGFECLAAYDLDGGAGI
jgi:hypothetical protein